MFLAEAGDLDRIPLVDMSYVPANSLVESFLKSREKLIPKRPDLGKSKEMKSRWSQIKDKLMKGIKRFHKSTKGKRFHRNLGRYLATKMGKLIPDRLSKDKEEKMEALKALSSIITHLYIEEEYFHPLSEAISFNELFNIAIPYLRHIECCILENIELDDTDVDFLKTLVGEHEN